MADSASNSSSSSQSQSQYVERKKQKPLTLKVFNTLMSLLGFLFMAWFLSVVFEFIGMVFFWSDEGSLHSQAMLKQELKYLTDDFESTITGSSPGVIAFDFAIWTKTTLFEKTHIIDFFEYLKHVPDDAGKMRLSIAVVAMNVNDYFQALVNTTLVFSIRVVVATLSMPLFLFIGGAAMIDGLVQREVRIYAGGVERAAVYHHVKPWIKPAVLSTWFLYLGIPFSIHPNLIFMPAMVVFGVSVFITFSLFKKYI